MRSVPLHPSAAMAAARGDGKARTELQALSDLSRTGLCCAGRERLTKPAYLASNTRMARGKRRCKPAPIRGSTMSISGGTHRLYPQFRS